MMRDIFKKHRLLEKIIPDIDNVLCYGEGDTEEDINSDPAKPKELW